MILWIGLSFIGGTMFGIVLMALMVAGRNK